jgi:hypothetical protein
LPHDFYVAAVLEGFCEGDLAMWMIILGALLVLAAATGAAAWSAASTVRATIAEVLSLLALAGAAGLMLFDVGPRFQELYIGFGVEVPVVTVWALRVLHFTLHGGIFLIANLIGSGVVGGISFYEAHRQQETRRSARFYSLIANSLVGLLIILFTAALLLPFPRLLETLS